MTVTIARTDDSAGTLNAQAQTAVDARADARLNASVTALGESRTVATMAAYLANNRVCNVLDYGGTGDGSTDDTTAVNTAITKAIAANKIAYFPLGTYRLTGSLRYGESFRVRCDPGTVFLKDHAGNGFFIQPATLFTGTVTAQGDNGLAKVTGASFSVNEHAGRYCQVTSTFAGVGRLQRRKILSNTADTLTLEYDLGVTPTTGDAIEIYSLIQGISIENVEIRAVSGGSAGIEMWFVDDVNLTRVISTGHSGNGITINTGRKIRLDHCRGDDSQFGIFIYNCDDAVATNCGARNASNNHSIQFKDCRNSSIVTPHVEGGTANISSTRGVDVKCSGLNPSFNVHIVDALVEGVKDAGIEAYGLHEECDTFNLEGASISGIVRAGVNVPAVAVRLLNSTTARIKNVRASRVQGIGCASFLAVTEASDVEVSDFVSDNCTGRGVNGTSAARVRFSNGVLRNSNYGAAGTDYEMRLTDCTDWEVSGVTVVHTDATSKSVGLVQEVGTSDRNRFIDCPIKDTVASYTIIASLLGTGSQFGNTIRTRQAIAYAASIFPSLLRGEIVDVGTLTGNIGVGVPTSAARGLRLTFNFTQDATGGRTVTWNAVFKVNWTPDTAANKRNTITFEYDGTNWVQVSAAVGL